MKIKIPKWLRYKDISDSSKSVEKEPKKETEDLWGFELIVNIVMTGLLVYGLLLGLRAIVRFLLS